MREKEKKANLIMVNQQLKDFLRLNQFLNQLMNVYEYENIVIILLMVANNQF